MSVISAKLVRHPRTPVMCSSCQKTVEPHLRLYGNAFEPDPKSVLRVCLDCAAESSDPKVQAVLAAAGKDGEQ